MTIKSTGEEGNLARESHAGGVGLAKALYKWRSW